MRAAGTDSIAAAPVTQMQAEVVVLAAPPGVERLSYAVPPELVSALLCGHRVIVPLRSRKVTGVVVKLGEAFATGATLKPIAEILEPQPILDAAHLQLIEFLASYYMTTLSEAYRAVIPGAFRIETRRLLKLVRKPDPLALAAFGPAEKAVAGALAARPRTMRQLARIADGPALRSALSILDSHGLLARTDAARGRHRESAPLLARMREDRKVAKLRGPKQRAIVEMISGAIGAAVEVAQIAAAIPGARAILATLQSRRVIELIAAPPRTVALDPVAAGLALNDEQAAAVRAIAPAIDRRAFEPFLLWGITASGKTEVYLQLAAQCIAADRRVLVLVPEIALTDQLVRSFRARFGELVAIAHSGQRVAERWASWRAALGGQARVMIGPRSAIFAPIGELGLIVVDEEHDSSYKQDDGIRYHARDLAVALARFSRCPVVLGSATPSAESFANTRSGRYRLIQLPRRIGDRPLAAVEVIDLRTEFRPARTSASAQSAKTPAGTAPPVPLSAALQAALRENLAAGGQSMIFINRRGYHSFLQCHLCGSVISCRNCSVAMTFHMRDRSIRCHYCGERSGAPDICPECRGLGLEGQGFGTERLVASLQALLPGARIERMDSDTSGRGGARGAILQALARGEIDVLVGTQMITKGFDFPGVTLVAAVQADLALNMPDFRSAERTFQLLTQVAGRAGRGDRPGRMIIQTWAPNHYSIRAARAQDYARFMRRELELRRELGYPPYMRMALIRIEGGDARKVETIAADAAAALARAADLASMRVLGPAPAPIERIRNRYRWQVMVKARALAAMRRALDAMRTAVAARAEASAVHVMIDIDPVHMM